MDEPLPLHSHNCSTKEVKNNIQQLPHVLPQPVIQPRPPGLVAVVATWPAAMLVPLIAPVAVTTAMSLGVNPVPTP